MTTVTRPALLSAMAYMLQAAGVTVAELAQHVGHKLEAAPIVLPPRPGVDADNLTPRELETLAKIDNPGGASIPELIEQMGLSVQTISCYVVRLERLGYIVRVKAPGIRAPRCFADPVAAKRWHDSHQAAADAALQAARHEEAKKRAAIQQRAADRETERLQKIAEKERKAAARAARPEQVRASLAPSATVLLKKPQATTLQGPAVETEATRKTIDDKKRPNARWQAAVLAPDPLYPSFNSTPLGVNPDTGRAWEARA